MQSKTKDEILDIQNLYHQGLSKTEISKRTGFCHRTIAKYTNEDDIANIVNSALWGIEAMLELEVFEAFKKTAEAYNLSVQQLFDNLINEGFISVSLDEIITNRLR